MNKQWKKEQASCCFTADVCLHQSVNQMYNNQNMAKSDLFSTAWSSPFFPHLKFRSVGGVLDADEPVHAVEGGHPVGVGHYRHLEEIRF